VCEIADHWYKELGVMTDADDGRLKVKETPKRVILIQLDT